MSSAVEQAMLMLAQTQGYVLTRESDGTYRIGRPQIQQLQPVSVELQGSVYHVTVISAPMRDVAARLSEVSGSSIVVHPSYASTLISISLTSDSISSIASSLAYSVGAIVEERDGSFYIGPAGQKAPFEVTYSGGLLSVRADSADTRQLMSAIADKTSANIVVGTNVRSSVTASVDGLPLEQALRAVCAGAGLMFLQESGYYYVTALDGVSVIKVEDGMLTLDVSSAEVRSVLQQIGYLQGVNISLDPQASGIRMTAKVSGVPVYEGLVELLKLSDLDI